MILETAAGWLSPARLLRDKAARGRSKGEDRYCRDACDLPPSLLLARLHDSTADLLRRRGAEPGHRAEPPTLDVAGAHLFWVDHALLYGYTETMLHVAGMLPWQGVYHQGRGSHAALASDLMEPFRHQIERTAMTMVLRRELRPDDFTRSPAGACDMDAAARRKYIALLIRRLETPIKAIGDAEPAPVVEHLHRQALSMRRWILGQGTFTPWRAR